MDTWLVNDFEQAMINAHEEEIQRIIAEGERFLRLSPRPGKLQIIYNPTPCTWWNK